MERRKSRPCPIRKIVSGGQSGADRAALDWAIANGIEHGGWCPQGRCAEDGPIDARYHLSETESPQYLDRTKRNLIDSDGTLIVNLGELNGGSLKTLQLAGRFGKPVVVIQPDDELDETAIVRIQYWVETHGISTLNVAGPRESKRPGIYRATQMVLDVVFPLKEADRNAT